MAHFWVRAETKTGEARAPVTPATARQLIDGGHTVSVELSGDRAFANGDYAAVGCEMVPAGGWVFSPDDAVVLGIKELPDGPVNLTHTHIYFGHAFKGQAGWRDLLARFERGNGRLLDLEYLTNDEGRRLAAFGYWAGFAGAALGLMAWARLQRDDMPVLPPLAPSENQAALVEGVREALDGLAPPTALVMGALGRCGTGATDLCEALGVSPTRWDMAETEAGGPFPEILGHHVFINCVLGSETTPVFVPTSAPDDATRKLSIVSDVSCDPSGPNNPIPIYDAITTFAEPVITIEGSGPPLYVTAIDHLPSLLPMEASEDYAAQLLPVLLQFDKDDHGVWARAEDAFRAQVAKL
ncbi:MAG: saccharopine dehydrogenase [Pseudomonadota bacterium]